MSRSEGLVGILAKLGARSRVEIAAAASPYLGDSAAGTSPRASGE